MSKYHVSFNIVLACSEPIEAKSETEARQKIEDAFENQMKIKLEGFVCDVDESRIEDIEVE